MYNTGSQEQKHWLVIPSIVTKKYEVNLKLYMTILATNEENDEMREIIESALDTDKVRGCCYELLALLLKT